MERNYVVKGSREWRVWKGVVPGAKLRQSTQERKHGSVGQLLVVGRVSRGE